VKPLIRFGIKQAVLMNLLFVGMFLYGIQVIRGMPMDRYPNIPFGEVHVYTAFPGASAEESERLVTEKLEDTLRGMAHIDFVRSVSSAGASELFIKFEDDSDYDRLYDDSRLRLLGAQSQLPTVNGRPLAPRISKLETDAWLPVIQINLAAKDPTKAPSHRRMVTLVEELQSRLEPLAGVKRVQIHGANHDQFALELDPAALERHRVTLADVAQALGAAGQAPPAGVLATPQGEVHLRVDARWRTRDDLMQVVIRRDGVGSLLRVGDLADHAASGEQRIEGAVILSVNGSPTVITQVLKYDRASAIDVKAAAVAETEAFVAAHAADGISAVYTNDSAIRVEESVGVLGWNLLQDVFLVTLTLALFISWRSAILATSGIAFAFVGALVLLAFMGESLNELTLVGLVLISGLLVSDAVIVLDNIQRLREEGRSLMDSVVDGTAEVFWPVINSTLTTCSSFLPLLLMTGSVGDFFGLIPIAVCLALAVSMFECMLLLPLHVVDLERWFGPEKLPVRLDVSQGEQTYLKRPGIIGRLAHAYDRMLRWTLDRPWWTLSATAMLLFLAVGVLLQSRFAPDLGQRPILKLAFFPDDASIINVALRMPEQTPLAKTSAVLERIEADLMARPGKELMSATGYAGMLMDDSYKAVFGHHLGFIFVELPLGEKKTGSTPKEVLAAVRADLEKRYEKDGVQLDVKFQKDGPPTGLPVNIRVAGTNEAMVSTLSQDIKAFLAKESTGDAPRLKGIIDLQDDASDRLHQVSFHADWSRLSQAGVSQSQALTFAAGVTDGLYVGDLRRSDEDIPVRVRMHRASLDDPTALLHFPLIDGADGRLVRLSDVGTLTAEQAPARLIRRDFQRTITVSGNLHDEAVIGASNVNDAVNAWYRPRQAEYPGATIAFGGEAESTAKSYQSLFLAFGVSVLLIYGLLATQFQSYLQPLLILSNVLFGFIGVVLGQALLGGTSLLLPDGFIRPERSMFTVQSFIAIVGLTGIVVNDAIVLIDFVNNRRRAGMGPRAALITAAHQRMRAMIMTSVTTVAGLLPMAIGFPEFSVAWSPMATCFVAGVIVSTTMTLLVVPVLYEQLERVLARFRRPSSTPEET
jgi:multidrug efflux pump subunit AcrB